MSAIQFLFFGAVETWLLQQYSLPEDTLPTAVELPRGCSRLQVIESKVPNLSYFSFAGDLHGLSLGRTPPIKKISITYNDAVFYARTELPSRLPNLEALIICSLTEVCTLLNFK